VVIESTVASDGEGDITGTFTASMSTSDSNVGDEVDEATVSIVVLGDDDDSAGDDDDSTGDDDDSAGDDDDSTGDDDDSTGDDDDSTGDDDDSVGDDDDSVGDDDDADPACGCAASGDEAPQGLWTVGVLAGSLLLQRRRRWGRRREDRTG